jgi:hypothetical protein
VIATSPSTRIGVGSPRDDGQSPVKFASNCTRLPMISERLNFFDRKVHNKRALPASPTIALNAAHKPLTIMVDLSHGLFAALAKHRYRLFLMTRVFCRSVISLPGLRFTASSNARRRPSRSQPPSRSLLLYGYLCRPKGRCEKADLRRFPPSGQCEQNKNMRQGPPLIGDGGSHYMATSPQGLWRERHQFLVVSIASRSRLSP